MKLVLEKVDRLLENNAKLTVLIQDIKRNLNVKGVTIGSARY